jgi:hypothetical protein
MRNKKYILQFFICVISTQGLSAQVEFKKNSTYFEVGGNGIVLSFNYERQLTKDPGFGFRLGAGIVPLVGLSIPSGINYLIKANKENSFMEVGFGITYLITDEKPLDNVEKINFVPSIGYRRHSSRKRFFRINFTPIINNSVVIPLVGISFGRVF